MAGHDLIVLLGFFIGMILYSVLFGEVAKRQNKLLHEYVFMALIVVLTVWCGLQFFSLFIRRVFGRDALEIYSDLHYWSLIVAAFLPPLLVHLHFAFLDYILLQYGRGRWSLKIAPLLFYLPMGVIMYFGQYTIVDARQRILAENLSFIPAFVFWLIVCLMTSTVVSFFTRRLSRNEKWRKFFVVEQVLLVLIAGLLVYFYFFGGTGNVILDKAMKNLIRVSAIVPTAVLIYLLFRYPFFSSVARRRFTVVTLAGAFLVIFIMSIKSLRKLGEENPELDIELLEILAASLIFILYEPVKYFIRKVAGYYALNQRYLYQSVVRRLSERIVNSAHVADLARTTQQMIRETLNVEETALFLLSKQVSENGDTFSITQRFGDIKEIDLSRVLSRVLGSNGVYEARKRPIFLMRTAEIPYQVYVGIMLENEIVGLLALGKKKTHEDFSYEEKELLLTLSSQIALAIENIELMQRRIELETRMYQADKLSSLGLLATSIAHEVKNPLSSIKSIVQSMHDEKKRSHSPRTELQDLEVVSDEISRLSAVVDQLLKFARPDQSEAHEIDVIRIVDTILTILRQEMRSKNVKPFVHYAHRPLLVRSRQGDLKEIIFNLILNGIQSMEEGGRLYIHGCYVSAAQCPFDASQQDSVLVSDRWFPYDGMETYSEWRMEPFHASGIERIDRPQADRCPEPESRDFIKFVIADSGSGIPLERLQEIFKPFYTTKSFGTGLGLSIVKNKVESLHGRLVVRSREASGTSFEVYIPLTNGVL